MSSCYIAGPMRGYPSFNFPLFNEVTRLLRNQEWEVISPAELDIAAHEPWTDPARPDWANDMYEIPAEVCRRLVKRDIQAIMSLHPNKGDRLIVLPGWRHSTGAFAEAANARWLMVPIWAFVKVREARGGYRLTEVTADEWGAKAKA